MTMPPLEKLYMEWDEKGGYWYTPNGRNITPQEMMDYAAQLETGLEQIQNILRDPFPESIYPQLSPLERNIAKMTVIDGMTARQVSQALDSPIGTVNTYLRMVYKALGVTRNRWPKLLFDRIQEVLKDGNTAK